MRAPELRTRRLAMYPLFPDDLDGLLALINHPGVRRYLWDDREGTREETSALLRESAAGFHERGLGLWGLVDRESGGRIGSCGIRTPRELVYGLLPGYWNRGLATEAAREVLRQAFEEVGLRRITASADAANGASLRVLEKLGMRRSRDPGTEGLETYEVLREAYEAARG